MPSVQYLEPEGPRRLLQDASGIPYKETHNGINLAHNLFLKIGSKIMGLTNTAGNNHINTYFVKNLLQN